MSTLAALAAAQPLPPGTTRLYLCRHGETNYNLEGRFQGRGIDSDLNALGVAQARALGEAFRAIPLQGVFSSTLSRAKATAAMISQHHTGVVTSTIDGVEEMGYGENEGKKLAESKHLLRAVIDQWNAGDMGAAWPGGESAIDVERRGTAALRELARRSLDHVAIVCHGRFNRVVLASLLHGDLRQMEAIEQDNTCVNVLDFDRATGTFTAHLVNCTDHWRFLEPPQ
ncbi:hypothetical protein SPRG_08086 [Saprolegnia parasitica CBS 223.65]|uniref:Phosphoglycerate mutase n=1 Tax=Saprolegnia parasitica (strain CBS 223.65) TaxID=695850 RepID=A0A067CJT8_SAPPC|nr:hypothetical protein SPRG_08086 [Saprolegnia parasitica CBS 223.65]KDO26796.1 hypothetical protein SPRG_08086 [Saprolegnia parasitica CBS 223.65]|eukprot:XP_012202444.1 hypothetical protein SPRG_08086 [Saprolegnia parasitica CBS 223.65]